MSAPSTDVTTLGPSEPCTTARNNPRVLPRMECMQVWGGNGSANLEVSTTGLDVWLYSQPFGRNGAGGDVYYLSSCSSGRITRLLLADVRGHGGEVVDLAVSLRRAMRRHINHIDQAALVRAINREFSMVGDSGTFATGLVATFFVPTARLTLSNAGHPAPLVFSASHGNWRPVEQPPSATELTDVPLGIFEAAEYTQAPLRLTTSDVLLCYTDGLAECTDEHGEMLGSDGVRELVAGLEPSDPSRLIPALLDTVTSMSPRNLSGDDVTVMVLRPNGASVTLWNNVAAPFRYVTDLARRGRGRDD